MFTMHTHEHHEIYCFLKGNAKYFVEGSIYSLSPGDILIMKKAEAHSLLINKCVPYERIIINFNDNAIVGDLKNNIAAFLNNREFGKNNLYSADEFKQNNWQIYLAKIYNSKNIDEQKLYLTVLLNELYTHASSVNNKNVPKDDIVDILEYINQNIANEITLTSLCERFFVSKTHLIRKFKNINILKIRLS